VIVIVVGPDLGWGRTKVLGSRALALGRQMDERTAQV
jgi:hypothetical protein